MKSVIITNCYTYNIDENKGIVTKIYSGSVSKQALMESWKIMPEIKPSDPFMGLIINYNGADFIFKSDELDDIVQYFKEISDEITYNIATICIKPMHYVLSTLIEEELTRNTFFTKTCSSLETAERFLIVNNRN